LRKPLSQLASYQALRAHAREISAHTLREWFARDPGRFDQFSIEHEDFLFDYSRNRVSSKTLDKLLALFFECEVEAWRDRLFAGSRINLTESRAVQHTKLRDLGDVSSEPAKQRDDVLSRMIHLAERVSQAGFKDVVSLGSGGSRLGPELVCDAFSHAANKGLDIHFAGNADAGEINRVLENLLPDRTFFIVISKSFTTPETLANAGTARSWLSSRQRAGKRIERHFCAVTAEVEKAVSWGILPQLVFPLMGAVGGRFSVWSAAGLSIVLHLGMPAFMEFLQGAWEMDKHFKTATPRENVPILLALLSIWNRHFLGTSAHAVLPYDTRLRLLPAYLQQLEMESNGKCVDREGRELDVPSSPVVFGDVGTNAQHGFFQFLHQGTSTVSCDFIGVVRPGHSNRLQHDMLLANMVAQAEALMVGRLAEELRGNAGNQQTGHMLFPGNRSSSMILLKELMPRTLGQLLALYEHKVFVEGVILNINSFDQPGVELGKILAKRLFERLQEGKAPDSQENSATRAVLDYYRKHS